MARNLPWNPQMGAVLVFAPGVTKEQGAAALQKLQDEGLLDKSYTTTGAGFYIEAFDPRYGVPVFYIP